MPLKHFTETILITVLALVIVVTGMLTATLPLLPQGALPGGIVLLATLLYAFGIYPLLKRDRADYTFRLLHFAPTAIVVLWFLMQMAAFAWPRFLEFHQLYTWGWTLGAVIVALLLLALFSLHVIRRRAVRVGILVTLLILYIGFAMAGEYSFDGNEKLAAVLWRGTWWDVLGVGSGPSTSTGPLVMDAQKSSVKSAAKLQPAWQEQLRQSSSSDKKAAAKSASSVMLAGSSSSPPHLPTSGPGLEAVVILFAAAYAGTLHIRARRRTRA